MICGSLPLAAKWCISCWHRSSFSCSDAFLHPALRSFSFWEFLYVPQLAEEVDIQALPPAAKSQADFSRDVEPLFREKCYTCHGPKQQMSGLRLDSKAAALAGGYSGPVIKPGNSAESKLIHLVAGLKKDADHAHGGATAHCGAGGFAARVDRPGSRVARGTRSSSGGTA